MTSNLYQRRDFTRFATATLALSALPSGAQSQVRLLVLGDSLSAEYGLARGAGWVGLLAHKLLTHRRPMQVINASVSGDTTAGGRSRLAALLTQHQPQVVIIELGGNDALRGLPLNSTQANLEAMVQACQSAGARVLLLGMRLPPNFGTHYGQQFQEVYADVARKHRTALVPFFLRGVADVPQARTLFQPDLIHPNEQAQSIMLGNVWPVLEKMLP